MKLRVAFVHNKPFPYKYEFPIKGNMGGAALSNSMIIREGQRRNHIVDIFVDRKTQPSQIKNYDLVILNHIPGLNWDLLHYISDSCIFVRWDHQYDFCQRGVATQHEDVCYSPENRCRECKIDFNRELHQRAILNVYQSPLHKHIHEKVLDFKDDKFFLLPPPIDTTIFKIYNDVEREDDLCMMAGTIAIHKGVDNVIEEIKAHPNLRYELVGAIKHRKEELSKLPNFKYIGKRNNYELPRIFNRVKFFVHLPKYFEPSSRSTMEAYLCGCDLAITNGNVGVLKYDWPWHDRKKVSQIISQAPSMFWSEVEKAFRKVMK